MTGARAHIDLAALIALRHQARGFSFLPRQPVSSVLNGRHGSRLRGRGFDFAELRHYAIGDDIRAIDWQATARQRKPQVRVFTEERDRPVLLVVDQRLTMFFGSYRATKSVTAAELAALAAWRVTGLGDRVGAIVFSDDAMVEFVPAARASAVMRILAAVTAQNQALGAAQARRAEPGQLNAALAHACRLATHDWLIGLITDGAGADDETVRLVTRLSAHNDVLTLFVHDALETALPDIGRAVVADGIDRLTVDTGAADLRRRYAADFAERRARIEAFSRHRAIPLLPILTDRDPALQVRDILGHRAAHR